MTPERLEGMRIRAQHGFDKNEYMPFGPGDVLELIAEIQRLQAALPTPAKEPSGELEKAVEERFKNAAGELEEIRGMALQIEGSAKDDVSFAQARNIQVAVDRIQAAYRAQVTKEGV